MIEESPSVSVVIPVYNRPKYVKRAIESVVSQTFHDHEIIVVDDGSKDSTADVLNSFGKKTKVITTENRGVSAARNTGVKHSTGKYIAFLDSDDEWLPAKLEKQLDYMLNKGYDVCQTDEIWIRNGKRVNRKKKHLKPRGNIFIPSLYLCLVTPSAVMMTKEIFLKYQGFDESLPACEDYDLWLRMALEEKFGLLKEKLVVKYGGHPDQLSAEAGLDFYRILSLSKILKTESLSGEELERTLEVFYKKSKIFRNGAEKRGRTEAVKKIDALLSRQFNLNRSILS